jgi:TPR repeat protein
MVNLGLASYYGNGVPVDHEIARNLWFRAGFEGNLYTGRNLFAACLKHGIGGKTDEDMATNIWALNARHGDTRAMTKLLEKYSADKNEAGVVFVEKIIDKSLTRRSEKLRLLADLGLTYL